MRPLKRLQRNAYLISRAAGDLDAWQRGPSVWAKRVVRRKITAAIMRRAR